MKQFITNKAYLCLFILVIAFSSCAQGQSPDTGSVSCLDNKPDPTQFSTALNAINHTISLGSALKMINRFDSVRTVMGARAGYSGNTLPLFETFNLQAISKLICQDNTIGLRIYLAMDDQQKIRYVLVGVDGDGKDVVQRIKENAGFNIAQPGSFSVLIMEAGQRWP